MGAPEKAYQPYAKQHEKIEGPGDARPTALQIVKDCDAIGKLKGKTILITGCSSGIGVETARALYEAGATLYLAARDMPKLEKVIDDIVSNGEAKDVPRPQGVEMHLDSLDSVRKGAEDFKQKSGGKLSMLINNAGVMASPYGTTKDGIETQIGVNHFAHFLLFQLVKDCLIKTAAETGTTSRVIDVSSYGHVFCPLRFNSKAELDRWNKGEGFEKWSAYGSAKTANILMANEIARRYGEKNVTGLSLHPGGIMTELGRHLEEADFKMMESFMVTLKNAEQGAATTVWAAVSDHFEGMKNAGRFLADVGEATPATGNDEMGAAIYAPHAYDEEAEKRLWKISCEAVGVADD